MTARGGPRQPANPAAVSGPGALSQRTDGGPGSSTQPIRVPSGGAYGQRAAAEAQQAGAPMAGGGPTAPTGGVGGTPAAPEGGVFGPTQNPGQSPLAGVNTGPPPNPLISQEDPYMALRIMYQMYPDPAIARLIDE